MCLQNHKLGMTMRLPCYVSFQVLWQLDLACLRTLVNSCNTHRLFVVIATCPPGPSGDFLYCFCLYNYPKLWPWLDYNVNNTVSHLSFLFKGSPDSHCSMLYDSLWLYEESRDSSVPRAVLSNRTASSNRHGHLSMVQYNTYSPNRSTEHWKWSYYNWILNLI